MKVYFWPAWSVLISALAICRKKSWHANFWDTFGAFSDWQYSHFFIFCVRASAKACRVKLLKLAGSDFEGFHKYPLLREGRVTHRNFMKTSISWNFEVQKCAWNKIILHMVHALFRDPLSGRFETTGAFPSMFFTCPNFFQKFFLPSLPENR